MRRSKLKIAFVVLACIGWLSSAAQNLSLSRDEFLSIVRAYHPVIRQANINIKRADASVLAAHGVFDPVLSSKLNNKELESKPYYSYFNSEITIPTWYGVDVKAGVDNASGTRLDPEATVGSVGYAGVKLSINSLVYDKRRAALQQARLMYDISESEKKLAVNEVIYEALSVYWTWVKEYEQLQLLTSQLTTTSSRIKMTKLLVEQGARPAMDSVEALAQYYTLLQQQKDAEQLWQGARLELSTYLWTEDGSAAGLPEEVIPDKFALNTSIEPNPDLDAILGAALSHPKLQIFDTKIDMLEIDKKLKQQNLIPNLTVNSAMLSNNFSLTNPVERSISDNYKIGVGLNIPIFMRDVRGSLKVAKLKIEQTQVERSYTQNILENKLKAMYIQQSSLKRQVADYEQAIAAYKTLYERELLKFRTGESTLFILNARELKLLQTSQKLIELRAKYQKAYVGLYYSAGLLQ